MIAHFKHYSADRIKKNEMVWACSTYGGEKRPTQGFGGGNLRKRDHLENPGVDGRIILTLWRQNYFFLISAYLYKNVNNTGTKQVSIMKQTAF